MNKLGISLLSSLGILLLIVGGSLLLQPGSASGTSRRPARPSPEPREASSSGLEAPALPARPDAGRAPERNDLQEEDGERVEEDHALEEGSPEPEEPSQPEGSAAE